MATELDWRSHQRTTTGQSSTAPFNGRRTIEDTDGVDPATFDDISESSYQFPEMPAYVKTVGLAAGAAVTGLALGYWLGGWRARRRRSAFSFAEVDLSDYAKLAPEVARLLKNPVVRSYVAKIAMRQVSRWLDN